MTMIAGLGFTAPWLLLGLLGLPLLWILLLLPVPAYDCYWLHPARPLHILFQLLVGDIWLGLVSCLWTCLVIPARSR